MTIIVLVCADVYKTQQTRRPRPIPDVFIKRIHYGVKSSPCALGFGGPDNTRVFQLQDFKETLTQRDRNKTIQSVFFCCTDLRLRLTFPGRLGKTELVPCTAEGMLDPWS